MIASSVFISFLLQGSDNPEVFAKASSQIMPYLIVVGTIKDPCQVFLAGERLVWFELVDPYTFPAFLLAAFYALNTKYPKPCMQFYNCLEIIFLSKSSGKVTPAVSSLLSSVL